MITKEQYEFIKWIHDNDKLDDHEMEDYTLEKNRTPGHWTEKSFTNEMYNHMILDIVTNYYPSHEFVMSEWSRKRLNQLRTMFKDEYLKFIRSIKRFDKEK